MSDVAKEAHQRMRDEAEAMEDRAQIAAEEGNYAVFLTLRKLALSMEQAVIRMEIPEYRARFEQAVRERHAKVGNR